MPLGDRAGQLVGQQLVDLHRDHPVGDLEQPQRQRAEPGTDLEHDVVGPDAGDGDDAADGVGVDDEVLPALLGRAAGRGGPRSPGPSAGPGGSADPPPVRWTASGAGPVAEPGALADALGDGDLRRLALLVRHARCRRTRARSPARTAARRSSRCRC